MLVIGCATVRISAADMLCHANQNKLREQSAKFAIQAHVFMYHSTACALMGTADGTKLLCTLIEPQSKSRQTNHAGTALICR